MIDITNGVLAEFELLSKIPRPSKYEFRIASYLKDRLQKLNAQVSIDSVGNVIADFPATSGFENFPVVSMQAHMDMVCVSDGKIHFSPVNDPIKLIRDEDFLRANHTSLGADDGIGIAIILYILNNVDDLIGSHGRWRIFFTVEEELGMKGARELDEHYLHDVKYLINIDSENVDDLVVGNAGHTQIEFKHKIEWITPINQSSYRIKVSGLKGGHSGEDINKNRANAIKILSQILHEFNCEINKLQGGSVVNSIPSDAKALITVDDSVDVKKVCADYQQKISKQFDEPNLSIVCRKMNSVERVIKHQQANDILNLISNLHSGVYDNSKDMVSANIGIIRSTDSAFYLRYMPRFHSEDGFKKIFNHATEVYKKSHFSEMCVQGYSSEWKGDNTSLVKLVMDAAKTLNRNLNQRAIHGGLECSHFIEKNPNLEIISVGTTNIDIHSPNEKLLISSIKPTVDLISKTLQLIVRES